MYEGSIAITPDLIAKRAWNVAATAAATDSATTATKSAAAGKQWVVTGITAFFAASAAAEKVVTVKKGTDAVRYLKVPISGQLDITWDDPAEWLVGDENEAVSAELAAGATSGATGYVSMSGFHIGAR